MTPRLHRTLQREFGRLANTYARLEPPKGRHETRKLIAWIRPRRYESVLDVACGPGALARVLAPLSARVCGLDLSPRMIEVGRGFSRPGRGPVFAVGDAAFLPYRSQSFDLVTCTYSFANFPRPLAVLRELARVTRRSGRIVLVDVLAPDDPEQRACLNRLEALRSRFYTRILCRSEFVHLLAQAHLRVQSVQLHRRHTTSRDWLRLSPAAQEQERAQRLLGRLADSIQGDKAGLHPRRSKGDILFRYKTAWFLLRPD